MTGTQSGEPDSYCVEQFKLVGGGVLNSAPLSAMTRRGTRLLADRALPNDSLEVKHALARRKSCVARYGHSARLLGITLVPAP